MFRLTLVLLFALYTKTSTSECVNGKLYPHPNNCTSFYQCANDVLVEMSCPPGLHFIPSAGVCGYPDGSCENTSPSVTDPTTLVTTEIITTTGSKEDGNEEIESISFSVNKYFRLQNLPNVTTHVILFSKSLRYSGVFKILKKNHWNQQ